MNEIDIYINEHPKEISDKLTELRNLIHELAPDTTEKISFQMPAFQLEGKTFIFFAAFKKHIGLYPEPNAIIAFADKLTDYQTSKGTIKFPFDKPLPLDLIKEIIIFRIDEHLKKVLG